MPASDEYKDETLEHMWDSDGDGDPTDEDYWNSARSYYACAGSATATTFDQFGGVYKRTIFHVYAFEGETICLGSSVYNSGLGLDHKLKSGLSACTVNTSTGINNYDNTDSAHHYADKDSVDIVMTDLKGNQIPIDIRNSDGDTTGYIASPKAEFAAVKMQMNPDGTFDAAYDGVTYTPYTYKVKETGLYTFEFHSYDKTGVTNPSNKNDKCIKSQWPTAEHNYIGNNGTTYTDAGGLIAALNITVFDENCQKQTGRTYADYLSLQMSNIDNKNVTESYYILTTDSYIYKMQFNNARPYTYNFFANNRGIFDDSTPTGETIYKSVKDLKNDNQFDKMGSFFVYPGNKETEKDKSFYIFLEYPDDELEGEIYQKALLPDPATDIHFEGQVADEGELVPGAYVGVGGYFSFRVGEATTATLRLEFKGDLESGNYAPVEITGVVTPNSINQLYWNGCDGNGTPIPPAVYSLDDIVYTVTAKAGEIHFPIFDMEDAPGGITFTRMSHIYDKAGNQLDTKGSIYDLTKNVIYYDETAIYYGEQVAVAGRSESDVDVAKGKFDQNDGYDRFYHKYANMQTSSGSNYFGEYDARQSDYIKTYHPEIRVGDHSHTTNVIDYFDTDGNVLQESNITPEQLSMINYLSTDMDHYPAGRSANSTGGSTTDYAIANFWTFIPAKPATAKLTDEELHIVANDGDLFKLSCRVFYDANNNAVFNNTGVEGEHLMSGVTLNLYKKTKDSTPQSGKTYYNYNTATGKMELATAITVGSTYEFVDKGVTKTDGSYVFTNLEYDKDDGTEYLYEVVRPDSSYTLTSGSTNAAITYSDTAKTMPYGYYASHSFNNTYQGTEIQKIKVGGTDGVDPTKIKYAKSEIDNTTNSVCAVDVGYYYATISKSLWLKKTWDPETSTANRNPDSVVYEVSYYSGANGTVYDYRTLSGGGSWTDKNLFLPTVTNGNTVDDYYVSAEYFIYGDYIYKYSFNFNTTTGKYSSFVADAYRKKLTDIFREGKVPANCTVSDLPDLNGDGVSDNKDLGSIENWESFNENEDSTSYRAVLDSNILADKTEITVTNSKQHGTIELFKYSEIESENNALQGATFRLYQADMETTMNNISDATWRADNLVGAATTRSNGRLTFTGLDSNKVYTVQELFAPDGYRITQEFYEVRPQADKSAHSGDGENVFFFGDKDLDDPDYAYISAGNAPADSSLRIRKRIAGRAWQNGDDGGTIDSFSFDISNGFALTAADYSELGTNDDISVDTAEQSFQQDILNKDASTIIDELNKFAAYFKSGSLSSENTVTINYNSDYYSYTDESAIPPVTISSADTKMSGLLLDVKSDTGAPIFQGIEFPMAGNYTFIITENDFDDKLNLEKSKYVYKVVVSVVRKLNTGVAEGTEQTATNTHLEASVSNITYSEDGGSVYKTFSGSSPLFTNEYKLAPAEQTTSYNIVKNFTGRDWKSGDEFTVNITSADSETAAAVDSGKLVITGFATKSNLTKLENGAGWTYTFKSAADKLEFKSFKFENIEFLVQYVKNGTDEVWDPVKEGKESPDTTQIGDGEGQYSPQTMPVTYTFNITETSPVGADDNVYKGITYDSNKYTLSIVLNNTEKSITSGEGEEEEDGIIEEIDVTLQKTDSAGEVIGTSKCTTTQHTMTKDDWSAATENSNTTYWYVNPTTKRLEKRPTPPLSVPADTKIFIKKIEVHATSGTGLGTNGHTMTIENKYEAKYEWTPQVQKVVKGREWLEDDVFNFTIALDGDATNVVMPTNTEVEITNKDTLVSDADEMCYCDKFNTIVFKKAGSYTFNITETDMNGTTLATYQITVELEDNGDGTLTPTTINGEAFDDFVIEFVNEYEGTSFDLSISKTIIGRDWDTDEAFTFKITPDEKTLKAIAAGEITMPTGIITENSSGEFYTVTLSGGKGTEALNKSLGKINVNNTKSLEPNEDLIYKFTISEVIDDLENMYCREPSYDLYIKVMPATSPGSNGSENTLSATYAYVITGAAVPVDSSYETTDDGIIIPFENVATGSLTVEKEVVSSNNDETPFDFTVAFTFDNSGDNKFTAAEINKITASLGSGSVTPSVSADGLTYTYTFSLKHGESITFLNILPNTTYTITEGTEPANYMFLRITDKVGNVYNESVKQQVIAEKISIEDLPDKYTFISGKIHNLPSAGGTGTRLIMLGGLALIIAAGLFYTVFYKNNKRRKAR